MSLESFFTGTTASPAAQVSGGFKRPGQGNLVKDIRDFVGVNLVDYSQIVLSTIMATFKPTDELSVDLIRHVVLSTIRANVLKNKQKYPHVVLAIDNGVGGYWRKQKAWYYKYKRTSQREESGWNYDIIFKAMAEVKGEIIENLPYVVIDVQGTEADDIIAVLTKHHASKGTPVLITSSDGDFTQLHHYKSVKQWSPMQKKFVKPTHGSPKLDLLYKCFKGDRKDGIAPFKASSSHYADGTGRSPSITENELQRLMTATEEELMTMLSEEHYNRYIENRELLDFEFIPQKISSKILDVYQNYSIAPRSKIYPYFVAKKLTKLMTSVSEF